MKYYEILILFLLILPLSQMGMQSDSQTTSMQNQFTVAQLEGTPIEITNNGNFSTQGWPGDGTRANPYLLENLTIRGYDRSILISNTSAFFVIRNCTVVVPSWTNGIAIYLFDVTNGRVTNCTLTATGYSSQVSSSSRGLVISQSSNVVIRDSIIVGFCYGIRIEQSTSCSILESIFREEKYGIEASMCKDTTVGENLVIGSEPPSSKYSTDAYGIKVRGECLNCTVIVNVVKRCYTGISTGDLSDCSVLRNNVTQSYYGITVYSTNSSIFSHNVLTNNTIGLLIASTSSQNTIADNILGDNTKANAKDDGLSNSWDSNWYSDYIGVGAYTIPGSANSVDTSPLPLTLHLPLLVDIITILLLIGVIPLGAGIGYYMRSQERKGKKADRGLTLFAMVLSVLLPCGISVVLHADPLFPNLKFVLVDVLFSLGISRSPGSSWSVSYYSSSFVSANDQLLLVSVPYLVVSILSIVLLMGYLRNDMSGKLFVLGTLIVLIVVMLVPLTASLLLVPITPLLSLSIAFWRNKMKLKTGEQDSNV